MGRQPDGSAVSVLRRFEFTAVRPLDELVQWLSSRQGSVSAARGISSATAKVACLLLIESLRVARAKAAAPSVEESRLAR